MINNKIKIVFVSRELGIEKTTGGIGSYVWDLSKKLVEKGHCVTIIASSYDCDRDIEFVKNGVNVIKIKDPQVRYSNPIKNPLKYWKCFFEYRKIIAEKLDKLYEENKMDIVEFAEFGAESLSWSKKVPIIIRWHTPIGKEFNIKKIIYYFNNKYKQYLEYKCINKCDCITFPSYWMKDKVKEKLDISKHKDYIIENGINFEEWRFDELNDIKSNKIQIVYAGTLVARKGFVELIEACKILREDGIDVELKLIGKQSSYSKNILKKYKEDTWINIVGSVDRENLRNYYYNADVCCFPSWFETVGIVCLEAMATGAIIVTTKNGGMAEIIKDGKNGFLVEPKNINNLYFCLKNIINLTSEKKMKIKQNAITTIKSNMDNTILAEKYINICNEIRR